MDGHTTGTPPDGVRPLEAADPQMIGGYPLLGRIGAGGMGTVFLAQDPGAEDHRVAVKTLHPHLAGDETFLERFRDEALLAARVASFCTARVLAHGEGDQPYIVSEYVGGVSLQHRLSRDGVLPAADLHGVAVSVASALAAIHAAGLVHRDLKPANVMLTLSGCRVIDFGIARSRDTPGPLDVSGTVLGTPGWMPPEAIADGYTSPAADVFAWGCLVAVAGTGRLPFGDGAPSAVALRVTTEEPDLAGLPEELLPAVRSALSKDPADRPTASELLLSLVQQTAPRTRLREIVPGQASEPGPTVIAPQDDNTGPDTAVLTSLPADD